MVLLTFTDEEKQGIQGWKDQMCGATALTQSDQILLIRRYSNALKYLYVFGGGD